jgi:hypothetical protein
MIGIKQISIFHISIRIENLFIFQILHLFSFLSELQPLLLL